MGIFQAGKHLAQDGDRVRDGDGARLDQRPKARSRNIFGDEVGRGGVGIESQGSNNIGMSQTMDRRPFALQRAKVLGIGGDFDGDKLIDPDMVMVCARLAPNAPSPSWASRMYSPMRSPVCGICPLRKSAFPRSSRRSKDYIPPATSTPRKMKVQAAEPATCQ